MLVSAVGIPLFYGAQAFWHRWRRGRGGGSGGDGDGDGPGSYTDELTESQKRLEAEYKRHGEGGAVDVR